MGGPNLEVFKFGVYIMFPIAWMYYFGTNLDERFKVPDFWPKPEQTYKIPYEKSEIQGELDRLRRRRLHRREQRLTSGEPEREGPYATDADGLIIGRTGGTRIGSKGQEMMVGGPLDNAAAQALDGLRNVFKMGRP